jgi:hypothetical protein
MMTRSVPRRSGLNPVSTMNTMNTGRDSFGLDLTARLTKSARRNHDETVTTVT